MAEHLQDLTIEEGGVLLVGLRSELLVPSTQAETVVRRYLHTLAQTMGDPDEACLQLPTSTYLSDVHQRWTSTEGQPSALPQPIKLGYELRQWLGEVLTTREVALWCGLGSASVGPATAERSREIQTVWERLLLPRTVAEVLRHFPAVILHDPSGLASATVLRRLAGRLARLQLDPTAVSLVEPLLAWPGPLLLPFFIALPDLAGMLASVPDDHGLLLHYLAAQLDAQSGDALHGFLRWRLAGDGVILLLEGLDAVADNERRTLVLQLIALFHQHWSGVRLVLTTRDGAQRACVPGDFHFTTIHA